MQLIHTEEEEEAHRAQGYSNKVRAAYNTQTLNVTMTCLCCNYMSLLQ